MIHHNHHTNSGQPRKEAYGAQPAPVGGVFTLSLTSFGMFGLVLLVRGDFFFKRQLLVRFIIVFKFSGYNAFLIACVLCLHPVGPPSHTNPGDNQIISVQRTKESSENVSILCHKIKEPVSGRVETLSRSNPKALFPSKIPCE